MRKEKIWAVFIILISVTLAVLAFFADKIVLYDFGSDVTDYDFSRTYEAPRGASTRVWFDYGTRGRALYYGFADDSIRRGASYYMRTSSGSRKLSEKELASFPEDSLGNLIIALPAQSIDVDGNGKAETVTDYARADFGRNAYNPSPQRFDLKEIPFELIMAEGNHIEVRYHNRQLVQKKIAIKTHDGREFTSRTNEKGWIEGLIEKDIRFGFTASYAPDSQKLYRMYYAQENYPFFSWFTLEAHFPLLAVIGLSFVLIALTEAARRLIFRYEYRLLHARKQSGPFHSNPLKMKTESKFLAVRWCFLSAGMFAMTYAGRLTGRGQAANQVAVPVFSCPYNRDQIVEVPCYNLSHIPWLVKRFGADYPAQNMAYATVFCMTLILFLLLFGRIFCGFLCPMGLIQDLMDKLRQVLHIRQITVTDKMYKVLQPLKWLWIILFVGLYFAGGDFCNICPAKVFSTAQGGYWTDLVLNGYLAVFLLAGSFFIPRFWCLMCPVGYLMGLLKRFNLFKLKKDCTSCSGCGACYEACPMRLKSVYTERGKENVQTIDCLLCGKCIGKCPEDGALSLTFCGKTVYKSERKTFLSRYAPKFGQKTENGGK